MTTRTAIGVNLTGRHVVVTGASRGIGRAVADAYAQAGATLTIAALEADITDTATELTSRHGRPVEGIVCDLTERDDIAALAGACDRVDVLVNNAGLEAATPLRDPSPTVDDQFRRIVETNLIGTFELTRALIAKIPPGGRIINTASIWAKTGVAHYSAYCASKHAIIGLTRSLAKELGPDHISVNAVCPGWVRTKAAMASLSDMASTAGQTEDDLLDEIVASQAIDGLMEPTDMTDLYLFLASDAARNITGQAYTIDRGELLQ